MWHVDPDKPADICTSSQPQPNPTMILCLYVTSMIPCDQWHSQSCLVSRAQPRPVDSFNRACGCSIRVYRYQIVGWVLKRIGWALLVSTLAMPLHVIQNLAEKF